MSGLGIMALEDRPRIDFEQLRRERLSRALLEMEREELDALILGREANARYVSGARRLWTVGTRPFGPSCVVVRRSASVHLLSTWDDGIPAEISHRNLIQLSWSPRNLMTAVQSIPGLEEARRIGIDGMSPLFAQLLPATLPKAEWADAIPALMRARTRKTQQEIACLRTAIALAEGALAAMAPEIRPGAHARVLTGRYCEEAARLGATIPAFEPSFCGPPREGPTGAHTPRLMSAGTLHEGDLVTCHAGVMYAGYEGAVGRTVRCRSEGADRPTHAETDLGRRLDGLREALRAACRPGASIDQVCAAYEACDEPRPELPILHGVGLGFEPPWAGPTADPDAVLERDMVVAVHAYVWSDGIGGRFVRDTLRLTEDGCRSLSVAS